MTLNYMQKIVAYQSNRNVKEKTPHSHLVRAQRFFKGGRAVILPPEFLKIRYDMPFIICDMSISYCVYANIYLFTHTKICSTQVIRIKKIKLCSVTQ